MHTRVPPRDNSYAGVRGLLGFVGPPVKERGWFELRGLPYERDEERGVGRYQPIRSTHRLNREARGGKRGGGPAVGEDVASAAGFGNSNRSKWRLLI